MGTTLNAHYTSPVVINAIYEGLQNLGFKGGTVLEPAMGVGNFFGAMPEDMRQSKLFGVELDSVSGRIAKQLYQTAEPKGTEDEFDYHYSFIIFGCAGIIRAWVNRGCPENAEDMAELTSRMILSGGLT